MTLALTYYVYQIYKSNIKILYTQRKRKPSQPKPTTTQPANEQTRSLSFFPHTTYVPLCYNVDSGSGHSPLAQSLSLLSSVPGCVCDAIVHPSLVILQARSLYFLCAPRFFVYSLRCHPRSQLSLWQSTLALGSQTAGVISYLAYAGN